MRIKIAPKHLKIEFLFFVIFISLSFFSFVSLNMNFELLNSSYRKLYARIAFINSWKKWHTGDRNVSYEVKDAVIDPMLSKFYGAAASVGARIEYIDVKESLKKGAVTVVPFDLTLSGQEWAVLNFLDLIREAVFASRFENIKISADTKAQAQVRLRLKLEKLDHNGLKYVFKNQDHKALDLSGRQLFKPFSQLVSQAVAVSRPDILKDLSLVGIIDDGQIKAVFEDKKEQKTYFLKKDDCIEDACLSEIEEKQVTFLQEDKMINFVL